MTPVRTLVALIAPLSLIACAAPDAFQPYAGQPRVAETRFALGALDATEAPAGSLALSVQVTSAARTVSVVSPYRWLVSDIHQYVATLSVREPDQSFAVVSGVSPVVLPQKDGPAKSVATFGRLSRGQVYRVAVVARGNRGGTAPDTVMNALTPAYATFDLSEATPTLSAQATVVLDPRAADPSGDFTVTPPAADGAFAAPSAAPTIEPVSYRVELP